MRLALTGATGFVGGHLLDLALDAGCSVSALARRPQPSRAGVQWIAGDLADRAAHGRLVDGAKAVIHVAGVLNAPDEAGFEAGNVAGTAAMLAASEAAGVRRFVFVSSLSAREPRLSLYGASKARAETLVAASPLDTAIVRPPAVYGPGDRETLDLFRMARLGAVLMPPAGRVSLIHADDLARLLLALAADDDVPSGPLEPDDGTPGGFSHGDFARLLGAAVGRRVVPLSTPAPLLRLAARLDGLVRGRGAKLTADRVSYFCHPDWVADPARAVPERLWAPEIPTPRGLADTAGWYRQAGWL
ncbi:NAD-dependent epimerase/dehydratase family protein [Sphingomonas ginkgonis]|uniref:NAD-dependent epimerase/dehydratase family protein n=1 Tax=Sphingomonas ginkgonis TaxID=2315330 RepID=A0A3R9WTD1_9SPHN|nr:NAD-dependent epimerase/dehydratase family protein [Sphingomonas ginkgonis]RST31364.1 NAD-dependent epimerase/dehydratase family protein [Sphingomonas ginkgonis]